MRGTPRITITLEELVAQLKTDPLAFDCHWLVYCEQCDKKYLIWPDRGGLVCVECQTALVALAGFASMYEEP